MTYDTYQLSVKSYQISELISSDIGKSCVGSAHWPESLIYVYFLQGGLKGMNCWVVFHVGKYQSVTIDGQHNCADSKDNLPQSKDDLPPSGLGGS